MGHSAPSHFKAARQRDDGISYAEVVYYVGLAIWIAYGVLSRSFFYQALIDYEIAGACIVRIVSGFVICAEALRVWEGKGKRSDIIAYLFLWPLGFSAISLKWLQATVDCLLIFGARGLPLRKTLVVSTAAIAVTMVGTLVACKAGIIQDAIIGTPGKGRIRHCIGFRYALYPAMYLFSITLVWILVRAERLSIWEAAVLVGLHVACYKLTVSRLSFGLGIIAVAVGLVYKFSHRATGFWRIASAPLLLAIPVSIAISFYVIHLWGVHGTEPAFVSLNKTLGDRLALGYNGLKEMGTTIFGQRVKWVGHGLNAAGEPKIGTYNYVDNLFLREAINYGWLHLVVFWGLFLTATWHAYRESNYLAVVIFGLLVAHCILDDLAMHLWFNPLMLCAATPFGSLWKAGTPPSGD